MPRYISYVSKNIHIWTTKMPNFSTNPIKQQCKWHKSLKCSSGQVTRRVLSVPLVIERGKSRIGNHAYMLLRYGMNEQLQTQQGKSEGFESCDRPIDRKRPIWVKIGDVLSRVTLKFDGWPWKTIGHLLFAVSSFVQHFIAIGEFKLELQSGNAQFESNLTISWAMWPWNLRDDLEKQYGTSSMLLQALCIIS